VRGLIGNRVGELIVVISASFWRDFPSWNRLVNLLHWVSAGNDPLAAAFTQALRDANPSTDPHSPHYSSHPLYDDDEIGFVPTRFYLDRNNAPASSVQAAGQGEPLPEDERVLRVIRAHQESARQQQVDSDRMEGVGIRQHEDT
jgi:hypothetical protein